MKLVVDTSVIIAIIADEPEKAALITETQDADLFVPSSLYWEIGNAFSAMFKRNRVSLDQALAAITIFDQIQLNWIEVVLPQAIELSFQLDIYAYDAYIVACAINENCPLLSLDRGLMGLSI